MSRKLLTIILLSFFFINACAPANVTVTSQVTVTFTPTQTPTATATLTPVPTVTFTPAPSLPSAVIADVEASLPGYTLRGITPPGYVSQGDQLIDPEGRVVPEMKVIPHTFLVDGRKGWLIERDYIFDGRSLPTYYSEDDIKVMPNGGLDMSALQYVDGQLKPKFVIHKDPTSGVETETKYRLISLPEAMRKVYDAACVAYARDPNYDRAIKGIAAKVLNIQSGGYTMELGGKFFTIYHSSHRSFNLVSQLNTLDFMNVETNEMGWAYSLPYYWITVVGGEEDGNYTYFGFVNEDGEVETYFIDNGRLSFNGSPLRGDGIGYPFIMFKPTNDRY